MLEGTVRKLKTSLQAAELRAKVRDEKIQKIKSENSNKTPFVQVISENIEILVKHQYLTHSELGFLMALTPFITIQSNSLKNSETNEYLTVSEISRIVGKSRQNTSKTIQELIEKGIIYEIVSALEIKKHHRSVTTRPLYVNPEILYKGDKNLIDPMLCELINEYDYIEKNRIKLSWKVFFDGERKFGKLVSRKTYLAKRKGRKNR